MKHIDGLDVMQAVSGFILRSSIFLLFANLDAFFPKNLDICSIFENCNGLMNCCTSMEITLSWGLKMPSKSSLLVDKGD